MKKLKLMTIVGTRPEIIRLSEVIKRADELFDHFFVHTGQNWMYELNEIFFKDLGLRDPDLYLDTVGDNLGETIGNIISKSYDILLAEKPDALLILGDTNSCLSCMAAKRLKIPIYHMEAGNRCFDQNVPEEINRRIVDVTSDVNLPYTDHSRRYLLSDGGRKEYIFVTGSPMWEVLNKHLTAIENSKILDELKLEKQNYILLSAHREENIDNEGNFNKLVESINAISEKYKMPVIYSVHPRAQKFIESRNIQFHENVRSLKPFGFIDYNALQKNSYVVLSDSGTLSEESAMLNFPGVLIRTSTERPEAIDQGTIVIGSIGKESVIQSIDVVRQFFAEGKTYDSHPSYKELTVSEKVVRIIQSYTPIINKFIWHKATP